MNEYRRYAVLVADTNRARIFVFGRGRILAAAEVQSETTNRSQMGGWSQMRYQRHVDNLLINTMRRMWSKLLTGLCAKKESRTSSSPGMKSSFHSCANSCPPNLRRRRKTRCASTYARRNRKSWSARLRLFARATPRLIKSESQNSTTPCAARVWSGRRCRHARGARERTG